MGFDNDHLGTLVPFGAPSTPSFCDGFEPRHFASKEESDWRVHQRKSESVTGKGPKCG
jgi:hypothetical protein